MTDTEDKIKGLAEKYLGKPVTKDRLRGMMERVEEAARETFPVVFCLAEQSEFHPGRVSCAVYSPLYAHDCDECRFLGRFGDDDLYACDKQLSGRTYIARYGDRGKDYCSGHPSALEPLREARRRAELRGI